MSEERDQISRRTRSRYGDVSPRPGLRGTSPEVPQDSPDSSFNYRNRKLLGSPSGKNVSSGSDSSFNSSKGSPASSPSSKRLYPDLEGLKHESSAWDDDIDECDITQESEKSFRSDTSDTNDPSRRQEHHRNPVHMSRHKSASPGSARGQKSAYAHSSTPKQEVPKENNSGGYAFAIVVIILALLVYYFLSSTDPPAVHSDLSAFENFVKDVDMLQEKFPNQHSRLWKTFKASAKHVLNDTESAYPSVILMAGDSGNAELASCLSKQLAISFESSQGLAAQPAAANVEELKSLNDNVQKKKLDDQLRQAFNEDGSKAFVIENLQALSPEAALLLHGYCDGDNAPFKDVMLVLLLVVQESGAVLDPARPGEVEKHLSELWTRGLHEDKVGALLSRVANNIVVVSSEPSDSWKRMCA